MAALHTLDSHTLSFNKFSPLLFLFLLLDTSVVSLNNKIISSTSRADGSPTHTISFLIIDPTFFPPFFPSLSGPGASNKFLSFLSPLPRSDLGYLVFFACLPGPKCFFSSSSTSDLCFFFFFCCAVCSRFIFCIFFFDFLHARTDTWLLVPFLSTCIDSFGPDTYLSRSCSSLFMYTHAVLAFFSFE